VAPGTLPERRVVVIGDDPEIDIEAGKGPLVPVPNGRVSCQGREAADIRGPLQAEGDAPERRRRVLRNGRGGRASGGGCGRGWSGERADRAPRLRGRGPPARSVDREHPPRGPQPDRASGGVQGAAG